jgi:hypothetical protein
VLHAVVLRRQHLCEKLAQKELAEPAAELRRAEDLLERGDVLADLEHLPRRLAEAAEAPLHFADDARGVVEPLAERLVRLLHRFGVLAKTLVDAPDRLRELLVQQPDVSLERLGDLAAKRLELSLQQLERGIRAARIEERPRPPLRDPDRHSGADAETDEHGDEQQSVAHLSRAPRRRFSAATSRPP